MNDIFQNVLKVQFLVEILNKSKEIKAPWLFLKYEWNYNNI